ncbi:NADH dehydrogenase [ubiquinone] 1 alpha subcomplex subunit 9, mitochondrial-like [Hibiscus syriacus]|uniref:NADH dehydrogenase [ubiquinone] 1 alpha subcomplex subunit 9, mitochondrial-like n=1 Tax=Hibiscus syriacus TaxID=106335 RepID=UPI001923A62E|nr:NADH dehydrogenase [ubiquinone] 1 alpha subcomplex subunit 9, mitochondrial-like [Hibiscus syriacus]
MEVIIRDTDLRWPPTRAQATSFARAPVADPTSATVFGATGFLVRYLVQQLAKMGSQVLVPFRRSEDNPRHLKLMGDLGQIVAMKYDPRDENSIKAVMAKANVVINLIDCQRTWYHEIYSSFLLRALSSSSRFLRAKVAGEEAATVMRPAVMIGTEDRIMNPYFAKKFSFLPLIGDGSTKIQPVYVNDVASAIVAALKDDGTSMGKVYELGGPDIYTVHELAIAMPREVLLKKVPFPLPNPDIFNLDQILAFAYDNGSVEIISDYNV